jgi:hypothetical protein
LPAAPLLPHSSSVSAYPLGVVQGAAAAAGGVGAAVALGGVSSFDTAGGGTIPTQGLCLS